MVKTMAEFRDELKALREEMFENAEIADIHLVASWVDRLVISLESISHSLELMNVEMETICSCCDAMSSKGSAPKLAAKKPAKKAMKKPAKKAKKKRR